MVLRWFGLFLRNGLGSIAEKGLSISEKEREKQMMFSFFFVQKYIATPI